MKLGIFLIQLWVKKFPPFLTINKQKNFMYIVSSHFPISLYMKIEKNGQHFGGKSNNQLSPLSIGIAIHLNDLNTPALNSTRSDTGLNT